MLLEYDVKAIFSEPGDARLTLYEALYDAGNGIRHVLARDERSASSMADACARLSHRPGAVHLALPTEAMIGCIPLGTSSLHREADCRTCPAYRTHGNAVALSKLAAHLTTPRGPSSWLAAG